MVFSQTGREINNLSQVFKNFGSNYALFNKSFTNIGKDLKNGLGIRSFTNIVSKTDIENFNKFNNALNSGIGYSQAFKDNLSKSSTTIQRQAVEVQKLRIQQNILNTQRQTGKITEGQYSAAMTANKAKMQALTTQTQSLTLSQKAATAASKALAVGLNLIGNIAIMVAINLIITGITKLVNKQKELRESISETAEEAKRQTDELDSLIKSYEEFAGKISYTAEEKEKLKDIQEQLSDLYHTEVDDIDLVNGKYDEEIAKLKELKKEKLQNAELSLSAEREQAKRDANYKNLSDKRLNITSDWFKSEDDYNKISSELENSLKYNFSTDIGWIQKAAGYDSQLHFYGNAEDRVKQIQEAMSILKKYGYANIGLYSELNDLLSEYQGYVDTELESVSNLAENMFQQYELDNPYTEVGQDSYLAWRDGLLATAGDDEDLRRQLFALAEKQFPDYSKYFDNLSKARSMFVRANSASEAEWAKEKDNYLEKLSPEDLEIATKIPDLFADGLDGATAKIEAWKADPKNKIAPEVEVDDTELSKMLETASKKVKLITTAMEEMNDTGSISSSTYGEIVEMGGNFADCLEIQNGKLKLNVQKLKDLEKQENLNAIAANRLAIAELQVSAARAGQIGDTDAVESIRKQISALDKENALYYQIIDEITNAEPDEKKKSSDPWKDEAESKISEIKHLEVMGEISHEEYINRLDAINQEYFANRVKYEDEFNKYEEEIYKDRKNREQDLFDQKIDNYEKLADKALEDNDFEGARTNVNKQITEAQNRIIELNASGKQDVEDEIKSLEEDIEKFQEKLDKIDKDEISFDVENLDKSLDTLDEYAKKVEETSISFDGTKLNTQDKWNEIRDTYTQASKFIQDEIDKIVQAGVEGNEEILEKLEDQLEEYQEKISDTFKDAAKEEQDYIKKLKDDYEDLYDENIDKIKEQQKAAEKAAQAEIDAVQEKIDALKEANEKAEEANEIEKARQDLANASQRTRQVYGADGSISFQVDKEKVKDAKEKLGKLLLEQQVNLLEEQKKLLEEAKDKQSTTYNDLIKDYEKEKKTKTERFNTLIKKLDEYLNPNNGESNSDVWKAIAKLEGGKYENGIYTDKDGNVIDINELIKSAETKTDDKKPETATDTKTGNSKSETKDNGTTTLSMERKSYSPDKIENEVKDKTETAIDGLFRKLEQNFGLKSGSLNLEKAYQIYSNSPMTKFDPYSTMNDRTGLANKEYVNNVNNQHNITPTFTGDINIHNPVGNSDDLAKELMMNIPIAFQKQMYSNLK